MTRKDYIMVAAALRASLFTTHVTSMAAINDAASRIASQLAADNPCFDREHFLAVVRGERDLNSRPPRRS